MTLIMLSRADADVLLTVLQELLDRYKMFTVEDFCELTEIELSQYDKNACWTSLDKVVRQYRPDGHYLFFPEPTLTKE